VVLGPLLEFSVLSYLSNYFRVLNSLCCKQWKYSLRLSGISDEIQPSYSVVTMVAASRTNSVTKISEQQPGVVWDAFISHLKYSHKHL
jgi:hypothetical protein